MGSAMLWRRSQATRRPGFSRWGLGRASPALPVLIVTGYESVETATAATHAGAFDYIVKPFEPEQISHTVKKALGE